jgi:GTP-binding protein Era
MQGEIIDRDLGYNDYEMWQRCELLKKVGTEARKDMESCFAKKVYLNLWVKVKTAGLEEEAS